jgi:hypothetical protein
MKTTIPLARLQPKSLAPLHPPRQLSMAFEAPVLLGLAADQRATAIQALAIVLLQAAGVYQLEDDDEQC